MELMIIFAIVVMVTPETIASTHIVTDTIVKMVLLVLMEIRIMLAYVLPVTLEITARRVITATCTARTVVDTEFVATVHIIIRVFAIGAITEENVNMLNLI